MHPFSNEPSHDARGTPLPPFWMVFTFWTLVAVIAAGQTAPHHDSVVRGALYELFNHWAWAALTPAVFLLAHRFPLDRAPRAGSVVVHLAAGAGVGVIMGSFSELVHQVVAHPSDPTPALEALFVDAAAFGFSPGLLVYSAILAAAHALGYYRQSRARESEALGLRTQLAEARLRELRMQLQPHFLFNTLNAVSGLVESDPAATRRVVARLSELLRHTLESSDQVEIRLARELELLESYLEIVRARFGDRVSVILEVDPAALDARVPPLCLQPLVENAVDHGVGRLPKGGTVEITARLDGGAVELEVLDDGPGLDSPLVEGEVPYSVGTGIQNVRDRVRHLHGDAGSVVLEARPGGGAVARVVLPFRPAPTREEGGEA